MTQTNSSQSGMDNPSLSPSQKQEASDFTASISPSSAQHGNALTEGGESASAKTLTISDEHSRSLPGSPTQSTYPQVENGLKPQEASASSECQKQSSGFSTMPHSTCCANSSCPKQTDDEKHSSTNSPTSDWANLTKSDRKELSRLYAAALFYYWGNVPGLRKSEVQLILDTTEFHLAKHKNESSQVDNQLRLTRNLRKKLFQGNPG